MNYQYTRAMVSQRMIPFSVVTFLKPFNMWLNLLTLDSLTANLQQICFSFFLSSTDDSVASEIADEDLNICQPIFLYQFSLAQ